MKNKLLKIIIVAIMAMMIAFSNNMVYAERDNEEWVYLDQQIPEKEETDPTLNPSFWDPEKQAGAGEEEELTEKAGKLLNIVNVIGVIVSVVMLVAMGIKYMLGSLEEKAEYKKDLIPYIVGAVLVMAGTTIPNIIYTITQSLFN